MARVCVAARASESFLFIDDVIADGSVEMNSEVYTAMLSTHIQANSAELIGQHFPAQEPAAKPTQDLSKTQKLDIL